MEERICGFAKVFLINSGAPEVAKVEPPAPLVTEIPEKVESPASPKKRKAEEITVEPKAKKEKKDKKEKKGLQF